MEWAKHVSFSDFRMMPSTPPLYRQLVSILASQLFLRNGWPTDLKKPAKPLQLRVFLRVSLDFVASLKLASSVPPRSTIQPKIKHTMGSTAQQ